MIQRFARNGGCCFYGSLDPRGKIREDGEGCKSAALKLGREMDLDHQWRRRWNDVLITALRCSATIIFS